MEMIEMLRGIYRADQMRTDEPMAAHTTMRVGGTVDHFVCPEEPDQLIQTLQLGIPCLVLGNGSNLIVRDGGLRGVAISTAGLNQIHVDGVHIRAQAGVTLPALAQEALRRKLSGLEFASGIPGSVGGAVCMNAGAYGGSIQDVIVGAWVLLDGETVYLPREELHMGYRTSRVLKQKGIVLEAEFALTAGDPDAIKAMMDDLNGRRRDKQPLNLPSSGSTFKRPEGHFAGALIERAGLKGLRVGGAQVSEKHAGFVVNAGDATAADMLALIALVQQRVHAHAGVMLECEVQIVGED